MAKTRTSTARRYAEAAFEIAERDGTVEAWLEQLTSAASVAADPSTVRRLENPQVPFEVRLKALQAALQAALGGEMLPQMGNLLALVLRRRRVESLPNIDREFRRLYNRRAGIVEASATSAAELDADELSALRGRLEQMTGGRVDLETHVDPSLLGGVQVRLGDQLIDGSVRGRLERLRSRLAAGALTP
ncbi:MAG: F0F1 ATP synthase subunit delta [Chloroflexota bacterium]